MHQSTLQCLYEIKTQNLKNNLAMQHLLNIENQMQRRNTYTTIYEKICWKYCQDEHSIGKKHKLKK